MNKADGSAGGGSAGWARAPALLLLAAGYVAAVFSLTGGDGILNGRSPPWLQNFDQAHYWQSARALAHSDFSSAEHWYLPFYSLLMAPFAWAGEAWAELIVGLALYLASFVAFSRIADHFAVGRIVALVLFGLGTLALPGMLRAWVWPWSTSLSAALILGGIAMSLDLCEDEANFTRGRAMALGAVLAAIPCARPIDGLVAAMLGLFVARRLLWQRREWRVIGAMVCGGMLVLVPSLGLYLAIWGLHANGYAQMHAAIGFDFPLLAWKAYLLLIEPGPWYPDSVGILEVMPWLLLAAAGVLCGLLMREARLRVAIVALPVLAYCLPMIAFRDLIPTGLWLFGNINYFKWALLLATLFAWRFVVDFPTARVRSIACLALVFALSCFSMAPVPAGGDAPARLLVFRAARSVPRNTIYMGETALVDRIGSQRNLFRMHAIPTGSGMINVVAQDRDFVGGERIVAASPSPADQRAAMGVRVDGAKSVAAFGPLIGRYRAELHFGKPCWLRTYRCPESVLPVAAR